MSDETTPEGPWKYRVAYKTNEGREESFELVPSRDKEGGDAEAVRRRVIKTNGRLIGVDPNSVRVDKVAPANANDINRFATAIAMAKSATVRPPAK